LHDIQPATARYPRLQARHFHIVHVVPVGAQQRPCADPGIECCNPTHDESSALLGFAGGAQAATLVGNSISAGFDGIGTDVPFSCTACFTPNPFTVAAGIETSLSFSNITPTFDFSHN